MKKDAMASVIVLFLFGGATTFLSLRMNIGTFRNAGTGMFPLLLGVLLMILSGLFLLRPLFQNKKAPVKNKSVVEAPGSQKQMIFFLGTMVLAALLFNRLGYPLISFLLMLALLRILGMKRWGLNILISVVTAVGSYFLFVKWLNIPMPKGWIGI
jgi:hypothetical protein